MIEYIKGISLPIKLWRIVINSKIAFLSEKWSLSVQEIANEFSILEHNITDKKLYGVSKEIDSIADEIKKINNKTHRIWTEMEKELKKRSK
jgi:hypothetical protein